MSYLCNMIQFLVSQLPLIMKKWNLKREDPSLVADSCPGSDHNGVLNHAVEPLTQMSNLIKRKAWAAVSFIISGLEGGGEWLSSLQEAGATYRSRSCSGCPGQLASQQQQQQHIDWSGTMLQLLCCRVMPYSASYSDTTSSVIGHNSESLLLSGLGSLAERSDIWTYLNNRKDEWWGTFVYVFTKSGNIFWFK